MIRPLTLVCILLFLLAGFYDYQTTHRVDLLDQQITATRAAAEAARSDTKVLQTEWSWLNRPDRLQPFAARFLSLQPMTPSQYVPLDQLAQHLPAPGSATPGTQALPATTLAATLPAAEPVATVAAAVPSPIPAMSRPPQKIAGLAVPLGPTSGPTILATLRPAPPRLAPARRPTPVLAEDLAPKPRARLRAPLLIAHAPPVAAGPVLVADNEPPRTATPTRTLSALGMAQTTPALPAPVAVSDADFRSDQ